MALKYPKMIKAPKRLTPNQVERLRAERSKGTKIRVLAARFGISNSAVCRIANRDRRRVA